MSELPVSPSGRRYGYVWQPPSFKAYGVSSIPRLSSGLTPPESSLGEWMPPNKDQGAGGACVFFTASEDLEALYRQYKKQEPIFSPQFGYRKGRELDGTVAEGDCGSTGETSCKVLNQFGLCLESEDPYDPRKFQEPVTPQQLASAIGHRAGAYHSLFTVDDIKRCIYSGYRVRVGFSVYESFEEIRSDGLMPLPEPRRERFLGGHETLAYAYDDSVKCPGCEPGAVRIRNSWSRGWGLDGDFWMPYEAIVSPILQVDAKIQHLGPAWK